MTANTPSKGDEFCGWPTTEQLGFPQLKSSDVVPMKLSAWVQPVIAFGLDPD